MNRLVLRARTRTTPPHRLVRGAAASAAALSLAAVAVANAAPAEAATSSFTALSLSAVVSGTSVSAKTTVSASPAVWARYYGVCVRSSSGANLDFPKVATTLSTAGTPFSATAKTFAPGTYSYFPCVYADGAWTNVGAKKTFTVGAVATAPQSSPSVVIGDGKLTLNWTGVSGATGYRVGRDGVDTSGSGAYSTTDPATARSRVFDHLVNGTSYTLFVEPVVAGGVRRTITATPSRTQPTSPPTAAPTPPTPSPTPTPTPTPSTSPSSPTSPNDSTPGWLSGAASFQASDGSFGNWRGSPVEIVGFWVNDPALYPIASKIPGCGGCGEHQAWTGPVDMGVVPPNWSNWANEANGEHDAFWTAVFRNAKTLRAGKGTTYIRPWYEYNGNWMSYSVKPGEEEAFKRAFLRINAIQDREFPASKLMLGTSAGGPVSLAKTWPSAGVDVLNIDFYNNWPFCTTTACFNSKIEDGGGASSLEDQRRLAESKGVPIAIGEWSNQGQVRPASQGGGGESPQFMRDWNNWLRANAGSGAGDVLYEVQFNLWAGEFELFTAAKQTTAVQPQTAEQYRRLW